MKIFIAFIIGLIFGGITYGWYKPMVERENMEKEFQNLVTSHCFRGELGLDCVIEGKYYEIE
jgi:hypothetical protein